MSFDVVRGVMRCEHRWLISHNHLADVWNAIMSLFTLSGNEIGLILLDSGWAICRLWRQCWSICWKFTARIQWLSQHNSLLISARFYWNNHLQSSLNCGGVWWIFTFFLSTISLQWYWLRLDNRQSSACQCTRQRRTRSRSPCRSRCWAKPHARWDSSMRLFWLPTRAWRGRSWWRASLWAMAVSIRPLHSGGRLRALVFLHARVLKVQEMVV